jgi:ribosomal protein S18 acetylase RimI-like enzyme
MNSSCIIRNSLKPGDLGWILKVHGEVYSNERDYDLEFEEDIARSIVSFCEEWPKDKAKLWIAEDDGLPIGSIALHHICNYNADLRWILVVPYARHRGIGHNLMRTLLSYCQNNGVRWINCKRVELTSPARRLYEGHGFCITRRYEESIWGAKRVLLDYQLEVPAQ